MKKQFLGLLLVLSFVVTLFPTHANAATSYNIWVGGTQVTSDNAANILGNNTARYDSSTSTLTLNNANISSCYNERDEEYASYVYGIYSTGALKIILEGNNTVDISSSAGSYAYAVKSGVELSIGGSGSLTAIATYGASFSSAICSEGPVTINSGTINANCGGNDGAIFGIPITIRGGTVESTGNNSAFSQGPDLSSYSANKTVMVGHTSPGDAWDNSTELTSYKYVKIAPVTNYTATVTVNKDGSQWTSGAPVINLSDGSNGNTGITATSNSNGVYTFSNLNPDPAKAYFIWEKGATDTYTGLYVQSASSSATINYYTLSLSAGTGITSVSGGGTYRSGSSPTINATLLAGYEWDKWSDTVTTQNRTITVNEQTNLTANGKLKNAALSLTGSDPSPVTFGYTTAPSMTVGISNKDATNFTYTYAWYEGSTATGTAIASATTDTYAPTGLAAGTHNYTVRVTATNKADGSKTAYADKTFAVTANPDNGSGSVTMAGWTYGGTASNPVPTSSTNGTASVTYQYKGRGSTTYAETATKPTNAGDYTVTATFASTDNYNQYTAAADFTIAKAKVTLPVAVTGLVYNGSEQIGVASADPARYTVSLDKATNAGSHTATATLVDQINYEWDISTPSSTNQTIEWSIAKAPVTFVVTNNNVAYNAGARSASIAQTDSETLKIPVNGYAVSYAQSGSAVASPTNKGSYDVVITISDPNFKHASTADAAIKVGTLTINGTTYPQAASMTWPTAANLTYGQKLSDSTLSGGDQTANGSYTWKDGTSVPTVTNSGYTVVFTPTDTNYAPVEHTVPVTVAKATPALSLPTAFAITFGQKLSVSTLTGGSASITYNGVSGSDVPGTFAWTVPDTMPSVSDSGVTDYALTFTPTDCVNYNVVTTGKIKLTVDRKEVGLTWSGHEGLVYSCSPVNVIATATGLVGADACTATVTEGNKTDAGTHTVTAMTLSNPNYKFPAVNTLSYTIAKAPATFVVTNNNLDYNAGARSATVAQTHTEALIPEGGYTVSYAQGGSAVASPTNKGSYDVIVTISDPNFKHASTADAAIKVGTLTINGTTYPQAASMTWPTAANLTYGQKLSDSTLSGGDQTAKGTYTWKDGTSVPTVTNSGYTVVFTPTDTNYAPVEHTVQITVARAMPTLSLPTAFAITFGQKLSVSTLTGGSASITYNGVSGTDVPGTFTWTVPDTMPSVSDSGVTDYALTFTPTDCVNYNVVTSGKIKLTVDQKEVGFTWSGHENLVYSGSNVNVTATATGLVGADACTATVTEGNKTDAGNYIATATTLSNPNYKLPAVNTLSYAIAKAPVTFVVSGNSYTYDGGSKTATVTQTAGQTPAIAAGDFSVSYQKSGDASGTADKIDAGSYDVIVTISDNNLKFEGQEEAVRTFKVGTLTIGKKPITALWKNLHHVYDGTTRAASFALTGVESVDIGNVSAQISGGEQKNVGLHNVTADLTGTRAANYKLTNPSGTLVIQKAPVTFTVSDDMVKHDGLAKIATVTATANSVSFTEFTVTYRKDGKKVETPTDMGSYDIYVEFTNTNYRHVDGTDGTARKIGVLNIYKDTAPATFTLSFASGEGGSGSMTSMTTAQTGTARALPVCEFTKTDSVFGGWQYNGKTYQPGEVLEQPSSNITLTAFWIKSTFTISGVVDQNGNPAADAVVTLMLGSRQIAETVTDGTGKYSFANVAPGMYNLVVSKNGVTQTTKVDIVAADVSGKNITLPIGKTNSVVQVASGSPAIVVGNLEKTFDKTDSSVYTAADKAVVTNGGSVEIKLTAKLLTGDKNDEDQSKIDQKANGTVALFLDLKLEKTVTSFAGITTTTNVPVSNVLLETVIQLPGELQGKPDYTVYRLHDGKLDTITTNPNADGEYIKVNSDKTTLTVYCKNFSTYAIAYTTYSGGGASSSENNAVLAPSDHGKVTVPPEKPSPNNKVTITAIPDKGYKVDTVTVTDSTGNKLKVEDNGNNTYSYVQPNGKVTITVTFKLADGKLPWNPFADVTNDSWFHDAVKYVYENNLMNGAKTYAFEPDTATTRGMIVTVLFRMEESPAGFEQAAFSDVAADSYYSNAIGWGFKSGIVKGYDKSLYGPEDNITREQLASILYRYAEFKKYDLNRTTSLEKFADGKGTSDYAKNAISWAVGNGLLVGKGDSVLDPTGEATRAEVATILMRFDDKFGKKA